MYPIIIYNIYIYIINTQLYIDHYCTSILFSGMSGSSSRCFDIVSWNLKPTYSYMSESNSSGHSGHSYGHKPTIVYMEHLADHMRNMRRCWTKRESRLTHSQGWWLTHYHHWFPSQIISSEPTTAPVDDLMIEQWFTLRSSPALHSLRGKQSGENPMRLEQTLHPMDADIAIICSKWMRFSLRKLDWIFFP